MNKRLVWELGTAALDVCIWSSLPEVAAKGRPAKKVDTLAKLLPGSGRSAVCRRQDAGAITGRLDCSEAGTIKPSE
jgi:hypothetical protein